MASALVTENMAGGWACAYYCDRSKVRCAVVLSNLQGASDAATLNVKGPCLILALLGFRHRPFRGLIVMERAEDHHVSRSEVFLHTPFHDVVILDDWIAALAAPEPSFLTQLPCNWSRGEGRNIRA